MVREGVFEGVDVALTWHPNSYTSVFNFSSLANYQVYFEFEGVASHAANSPHLGRSALDAVELMNVGVNYLREHIPSSARVHYAVTNTGGSSPNVVQAEAEVLYLIRANTIKEVDEIYKRIVKIAEGAAMMTETKVKVKFDKACSNYIPNDTINKIIYDKLQLVGLPTYTNEELEYAKKMNKTISDSEYSSALREIKSMWADSPVDDLEKEEVRILLRSSTLSKVHSNNVGFYRCCRCKLGSTNFTIFHNMFCIRYTTSYLAACITRENRTCS